MKKEILTLLSLIHALIIVAQVPDGKEIMLRVDENMSSENRYFTSEMIIHSIRSSRTLESRTWTRGEENSFTEYLFPVREKGTKMLKLEDQLWIYSPTTDRTLQITGHMLRQAVMGSDMSYEDLMEDTRLLDHYDAEVTGSENVGGDDCWIVELKAFDPEVTYQGKKLWVDKVRYIPLKEEMFAKSGTLLKRTELSDITQIDGRWYPKKIVFKDMLQDGEGTEFIIKDIQFNIDIPDHVFSKGSLKK